MTDLRSYWVTDGLNNGLVGWQFHRLADNLTLWQFDSLTAWQPDCFICQLTFYVEKCALAILTPNIPKKNSLFSAQTKKSAQTRQWRITEINSNQIWLLKCDLLENSYVIPTTTFLRQFVGLKDFRQRTHIHTVQMLMRIRNWF